MLANEWWPLCALPLIVFIFRFIISFGLCSIYLFFLCCALSSRALE
jgi:hypothetical protein